MDLFLLDRLNIIRGERPVETHQFGTKVLPGIVGKVLYAGIWERDILVADIEMLENLEGGSNSEKR